MVINLYAALKPLLQVLKPVDKNSQSYSGFFPVIERENYM